MNKITSFTINHLELLPGVYVSRKDNINGAIITTFDIRMTRPNFEPVMNTAELHAIEHLGATFLRNHKEYGSKIVYFGPMGCRTGLYLLLGDNKEFESREIIGLVKDMFQFIAEYDGEIPGASPRDCGNYLDMNLPMAKYLARKYLENVLENISEKNLNYPE
ncbi:S-ribosylhomocysteine lyase [Clostridium sp.]|uniref:S-ribosylhomocysteine lyase n=1 Tax=Clostridium sp. TaxID=1506 RepID=UPI002FDE4C24